MKTKLTYWLWLKKKKLEEQIGEIEEDKEEQGEQEEQCEKEEDPDILEEYFQGTDIDYKEIFAGFLNNNETKQKIVKILEEVDSNKASYLNLIITSDKSTTKKESEEELDKVSFTKALLKVLYKLDMIKCKKVGMIDGKDLNVIDFKQKKKVIKDCSLIIDNASLMDEQAVDDVEELILDNNQKILVVLLDDQEKINKLFEKQPQLFLYFHKTVEL